jgi:hypothetical protein
MNIITVEGNTSAGNNQVIANGGCVARKEYSPSNTRIHSIWLPKYADGEALKVAKEALKYVGYLEKKSNAQLESFTANAGYNNYNMFAEHARKETRSGVYVNGVAWCDIFHDDVFIRALGVTRAKELLGGWSAYTPTSKNYLEQIGAEKITDYNNVPVGAIIFFKNSSGVCHVGIAVQNTELGEVTYTRKQFVTDVMTITNTKSAKQAFKKTVTLSKTKNNKHALVLPVQRYLKTLGYYSGVCDRDFGSLTESAVKKYQANVVKATGKNIDGIMDKKQATWKKMLGV